MTALATASVALKASAKPEPPTGTLCGHVFGRGLRFGKTSNNFTVPGAYLLIFDADYPPTQWPMRLIDKLFTDENGYFEINLPPGSYVVRYPVSQPVGAVGIQRFRIEANKITLLGLS